MYRMLAVRDFTRLCNNAEYKKMSQDLGLGETLAAVRPDYGNSSGSVQGMHNSGTFTRPFLISERWIHWIVVRWNTEGSILLGPGYG